MQSMQTGSMLRRSPRHSEKADPGEDCMEPSHIRKLLGAARMKNISGTKGTPSRSWQEGDFSVKH